MKDDIRFYNEEQTHKYKRAVLMNSIIYGSSCILFGIINIILYLFCDDTLYLILNTIFWLLFINFSIIFIDNKVLQIKRVLSLYDKLDFGNKIQEILCFVQKNKKVGINHLEFDEYLFTYNQGEEVKRYLYTHVPAFFQEGQKYCITLVNDMLYGGQVYEE